MNMNISITNALFSTLIFLTITTGVFADANQPVSQENKTATASIAAPMTDGEIKKINKDTGKITIKHGEIKNLDMPAMTMVFKVKDPATLDQLKAGDKIKFTADKINGALTVTEFEKVKE